MSEHPEQAVAALSLIERKQRAARSRIIQAADLLFAERGFDGVSVTDIAERAEVGRTTFFRHFTDKTEVVFAKEQAMFDAIADLASETRSSDQSVDSLAGALSALEPLVIRLCEYATADLAAYQRHTALVETHDELRAREALKHQHMARQFADVLRGQGAPSGVATTAGQLALACYSSGHLLATSPDQLVATTRAAFRDILTINEAPTQRGEA